MTSNGDIDLVQNELARWVARNCPGASSPGSAISAQLGKVRSLVDAALNEAGSPSKLAAVRRTDKRGHAEVHLLGPAPRLCRTTHVVALDAPKYERNTITAGVAPAEQGPRARKRDHAGTYRRRQERAKELGFSSYAEMRRVRAQAAAAA